MVCAARSRESVGSEVLQKLNAKRPALSRRKKQQTGTVRLHRLSDYSAKARNFFKFLFLPDSLSCRVYVLRLLSPSALDTIDRCPPAFHGRFE